MGLSSIFLILFFISTNLLAVDLDCSFQKMAQVRKAIQKELDGKKSIAFDTYGAVENVMLCDLEGKLEPKLKKQILSELNELKNAKPTPFVWATREGVEFWDDGVSKMGFLPEGLRETIPVILSQLNSSVVAFVPSETDDNGTYYQFEADLGIDLFSPWDRRSCQQMPKSELEDMSEDLRRDRISKKEKSNFTRNYAAIEVSKIGLKSKPSCFYYPDKEDIICGETLSDSIIHESLHFLNNRFPTFSERLLAAKGGYQDRLKIAQEVEPKFGKTMCTPSVWEEHCTDGPITNEQATEIAKRAKLPQDYGTLVGKQYASELRPGEESCWQGSKQVERRGKVYCVDQEEGNLYVLVRGGDEYLQVLYEKAINDEKQFEKVASDEEKKLFKLMKEYLF